MAKSKASKSSSSDIEKWKKIFNSLVLMLRTQHTQIGSLAKDRKLLEDRIKLHHDRWISDVKLFQDQISQMKRDFSVQEMERMLEAAKADMLLGLRQREAFVCKNKLENAESDLADFRDWFDYLSRQCSADQSVSASASENSLLSELRRLKSENEKLTAYNNSEVSALLSEKKFVWNQYNKMERDLNELLRVKRDEVKSANEKIQILLSSMEDLQSSNTAKDKMIASLQTGMAKLESDSLKKDEEISQLSKELELLRKSKNDSGTPTLRPCTSGSGRSQLNGKKNVTPGWAVTIKKESGSLHGLEKVYRSSKRKAAEIIDISDTPKLLTSSFKVPKLKTPSPALK